MKEVEVKTEMPSPTLTSSGYQSASSPDYSIGGKVSTRKLDPVDKWRSRVLFCGPKTRDDEEESWSKKIEKQMAVLRVAFPFLTEKQIRGKAWQSCGFTSVMGCLPRHGLAPGVKKEFIKRRSPRSCSQKSKVKKESVKNGRRDKKISTCPYTFASPNGQLLTPQNVIENLNAQSPLATENDPSLTMGDDVSTSRTRSAKKKMPRSNKKTKNLGFETPKRASIDQDIVPETPKNSIRSTTPFCSQPLHPNIAVDVNVIPSLLRNNYATQAQISECSSTAQPGLDKENLYLTPKRPTITHDQMDDSLIDSDPTESGLYDASAERNLDSTNNCLGIMTPIRNAELIDAKKKMEFSVVAEVHHSDSYQPENQNNVGLNYTSENLPENLSLIDNIENSQMCTPKNFNFIHQEEIKSTTNFSMDVQSYVDVDYEVDSASNNPSINANPFQASNVSFDLSNNQTFENLSQQFSLPSVSLPTTPLNSVKCKLPDSVMLSNFCSEYDKAYTKKDLNPNTFRNYRSTSLDKSLKNHFDQVIPPHQSLESFFNAPDKSFKKIQNEVRNKVKDVLLFLEEDEEENS